MNTSWTVKCAPRSGGSEAPHRAAHVHYIRAARARKAGATRRRRRSLFQRRRTRSAHQPSRAQPAVGQRTTQHQPLLERCTDTESGRGQGARVLGRTPEWWRWSVAPLFMTFWKDIHGVVPLLATRDSTHTVYTRRQPRQARHEQWRLGCNQLPDRGFQQAAPRAECTASPSRARRHTAPATVPRAARAQRPPGPRNADTACGMNASPSCTDGHPGEAVRFTSRAQPPGNWHSSSVVRANHHCGWLADDGATQASSGCLRV